MAIVDWNGKVTAYEKAASVCVFDILYSKIVPDRHGGLLEQFERHSECSQLLTVGVMRCSALSDGHA